MYSKQNSLQHPDLSIKQGKALVSERKKVQRAQRRYVRNRTNGMDIWFAAKLLVATFLAMATLAMMQHWTGTDNLKDAIVVIAVVSTWPLYHHWHWMQTKQTAISQFRNSHPVYAEFMF